MLDFGVASGAGMNLTAGAVPANRATDVSAAGVGVLVAMRYGLARGIYAGIVPARNGQEAYHLIIGAELGRFEFGSTVVLFARGSRPLLTPPGTRCRARDVRRGHRSDAHRRR